jgi:hypothetical protein
MRSKIMRGLFVVIAFLMCSCSTTSGQIASFEDLTTDSHKEGWLKIPQYRVISITGLLPFTSSGSLHFYKRKRKPSSAIGLSNKSSYVVENTVGENDCDMDCLAEIRGKILLVKNIASRLIEEKIDLIKLQSRKPVVNSSDVEISAYQTTISAAEEKYRKSRIELDAKHLEAVNAINKNGVIVFRWNTKTEKSASFSLGSLFGASGKQDKDLSGFGILSGLKIATLYVGRDVGNAFGNIDRDSRYSNRFEITTYAMHAKHIMYMSEEDLSTSLGTNLRASYSQLENIDETAKAFDNIEMQAVLSKASNLSNIGVIGNSVRKFYSVDWNDINSTLSLSGYDGWQTIYSVKSDLIDVIDMMDDD